MASCLQAQDNAEAAGTSSARSGGRGALVHGFAFLDMADTGQRRIQAVQRFSRGFNGPQMTGCDLRPKIS